MKMPCEVCGTTFEMESYSCSGESCPNCGAIHAYEEGTCWQHGKVVSVDKEHGEVTLKIVKNRRRY